MRRRFMLYAEDSQDDAALTLIALKKSHAECDVVVVSDGAEAVDFLFGTGRYTGRDTESAPFLLLLDLKMPRVGGHEVLRRIRSDSRTASLPVVVFTSSLEQRDVERAYALGANSYVRKPVDFESFSAAVGEIGRYWLSFNRAPQSLH